MGEVFFYFLLSSYCYYLSNSQMELIIGPKTQKPIMLSLGSTLFEYHNILQMSRDRSKHTTHYNSTIFISFFFHCIVSVYLLLFSLFVSFSQDKKLTFFLYVGETALLAIPGAHLLILVFLLNLSSYRIQNIINMIQCGILSKHK